MNTLSAIATIARFEAKTLARGWFFRIFAALAIIIIFFFNLMGYTAMGDGGWPGRLLPGSVPYMNLFLLNISQAVIAIFISSDFLGRDKKLDTTEAFYVRSVSNFAYVIGKTFGIIKVFFFLNLAVLVIGAIFNFIATDVDFIPVTYLIYPLLISLPTMLLVLGMSFFLMVLIRNQAVTFILMLGFLGASLFYLSNQWYNVFDFVGFNTPMMYSVFTGLPDVSHILLMRGAYALLGLAFVFFTILMLPRLPQERYFKIRALAGIAITLLPAVIMLSSYVIIHKKQASMRAEMLRLDETLPLKVSGNVKSAVIDFEHKGIDIIVKASLKVCATATEQFFVLNPGFKVTDVIVYGKSVPFKRNLHLISFSVNDGVPGDIDVEIKYTGKPDNAATFAEIPEDIRVDRNRLDPLVAGKAVSFIRPEYILLTREAAWYPVAASRNYRSQPQFTQFSINARIAPGLTALSLGQPQESNNGVIEYRFLEPLNALSFTAGNYLIKTVMVDSLEISLAVHPKNLRFLEYFNDATDTIPFLIKEMKDDYERRMGHTYPFEHFCLVEAPIHFYAYPRSWTLATEDNMPGQVFMPERGAGNFQSDLKRQIRWIERQSERDGESLLPQEVQARMFKNVVGNMLITPSGAFRWRDTRLRNLPGWTKEAIFPQYTSYRLGIEQEGFPILQFITENYLLSRVQTGGGRGGFGPEGNTDQVILKMKGKNLIEILDSMKYHAQLPEIVSRKGTQFFNTVQMNIRPKEINKVLDEIIAMQSFKLMPVDTFISKLNTFSDSNIESAIDEWMHNAKIPAFLFGNAQAFEITDDNRTRYFIRSQVANNGEGDGILTIGVREQTGERGGGRRGPGGGGGGGGFGPGMRGGMPAPSVEETFLIPKGQQVTIGIMTDGEPRELIYNTYVAENLPSSQRLTIQSVSQNRVTPFEGIHPYDGVINFEGPNEYIVDNEDSGFSIENQQEKRTAKDWWMSRTIEETGDKYQYMNSWMPSHKWQPVLGANYFGKYIKSAVYKRKGTGDAIVKWETELPESGNYSVYTFVPQMMRNVWRRGRQQEETGSYLFTVFNDDGETVVEIDPNQSQGGWLFLGDFYISRGNTSVTLSDNTSRSVVIADAVKWVRKK